jgi:hypothetical protein
MVDWPYQLMPRAYWFSFLVSDVRREPSLFVVNSGGPDADACANNAIRWALEHGADEILFVSCDQMFPPHFLTRARASGKSFVTALTATRQAGHHWLTFQWTKDGTLVQQDPTLPFQRVGAGGMGCWWARREVFERLPMPWFKTTLQPDGCECQETSDFYFFRKCREHGQAVYVDAESVSDHQYEVMLNCQSLGRSLPRLEIVEPGGAQ